MKKIIGIIIAGIIIVMLFGNRGSRAKQQEQEASGRTETSVTEDQNVKESEDRESQEQTEETQSDSQEEGISPEFKAAMDSYEEFFDEYAEFMKKYSESDNAAAMLMDYTNYMMKYADTMEKLDQIKSEELTLQEEQYYIEVMARIQKKLLEASQ